MAEEASSKPDDSTRNSDDPDYRRLWAMSFREMAEIEADPEHPLHEKAKEVSREVIAPMRPLFDFQPHWNLAKHFDLGIGKPIDLVLGKWATESLSDLSSTSPKRIIEPAIEVPTIHRTAKGELTVTGSGEVSIDLSADEAPAETAAQVQDAVQIVANQYLERLVNIQADQLSHQRGEAVKSGEREKLDRRIAWATLIVAAVTLVASVILGLPGFLDSLAPLTRPTCRLCSSTPAS